MSFPAYPTYRESGVEWLGQIPGTWAVKRIKDVAYVKGRVGWKGLTSNEYLDEGFAHLVTGTDFRTQKIDWNQCVFVDVDRYNDDPFIQLRNGDLLITKDGTIGKVALVDGLRGPACLNSGIFLVRPLRDFTNAYLYWVLKSAQFAHFVDLVSLGSTINHLYQNVFESFAFPIPSRNEQDAIATFLDRETAKIDVLMDEQRRLITLLKEKRQAVVFHGVVKGLNPDAPMKDRGVEWLGEMPAHWEVRRLKHLSPAITVGIVVNPSEYVSETGVPFIYGGDIREGSIDWATSRRISLDLSLTQPKTILRAGDLLTVRVGAPGVTSVVPSECDGGNCASVMHIRKGSHSSDWLCFAMNSRPLRFQVEAVQYGAAQEQFNISDAVNFMIPTPPVSESLEIATYLTERVAALDELIGQTEIAIVLLKERRSALISAAVIGKIDVRRTARVRPLPLNRPRARGLIAAEIIERSARNPTFGRVKLQKIAYLAEAHANVTELEGAYLREAAGPLDREMIREMEHEAGSLAGIRVEQPHGAGSAVAYRLGERPNAHRQDLAALLGNRVAKFNKLVEDIGTIDTKGAEAVATLYAVWNDALIDGETPDDMEIKLAVLTEWHPEKAKKFRLDELQIWLDWMRRHGLVPTGTGPKTSTGRLFA